MVDYMCCITWFSSDASSSHGTSYRVVKSDSKGIKNDHAKMYGLSAGNGMDPGNGRTPSRAPDSDGPYSRAISHEFQHSSLSTAAIVASSFRKNKITLYVKHN